MTTTVGLELVWADAGGATDPTDAKYQLGWIAEIPTFQNFNWVLQNLDKAKLAYAEGDIYLWQDKIAYRSGARVERGDKTFYCITPHNDSAGSNPQDPLLDTTNSYWVSGIVFSSLASAYAGLRATDGIKLDQMQQRANDSTWTGNDITIWNKTSVIALNNSIASGSNYLLANVKGKLVVVDVDNVGTPDGRSIIANEANKSYEIYHKGNKPVQSEVSGTIPQEPADGKLYARRSGNWVEVTATTIGVAPPPPVKGAGQGWYNLDDGQFYLDINDGDSSQWVPANPPMIPDLAPIEQKVSDLSNAFVGMESNFPPRAGDGVHPAWIEKAGGTFSRAAYPSLWTWAEAHNLVVSEVNWQAIKAASPNGSVSVYSSGDGSTTFRTPDVGEEGGFARSVKGATGAGVPIGDLDGGFGSQSAVVSGSNETSPRGSYQRIYVYTGNIVENLPTPTPDWLAQQAVNTNNITDLLQQHSEEVLWTGNTSNTATDIDWSSTGFQLSEFRKIRFVGAISFTTNNTGLRAVEIEITPATLSRLGNTWISNYVSTTAQQGEMSADNVTETTMTLSNAGVLWTDFYSVIGVR